MNFLEVCESELVFALLFQSGTPAAQTAYMGGVENSDELNKPKIECGGNSTKQVGAFKNEQ